MHEKKSETAQLRWICMKRINSHLHLNNDVWFSEHTHKHAHTRQRAHTLGVTSTVSILSAMLVLVFLLHYD